MKLAARSRWREALRRSYGLIQALAVLILLVIVISLVSPRFLTLRNITNLMAQKSVNLIVAAGVVMISGEFDISVGSVVALTAAVSAALMTRAGVLPGVLLSMLIGPALGVFNGVISLAFVTTGGRVISNLPEGFKVIGQGQTLGVPNPFLIALACYAIGYVLMTRTAFGKKVYAVGANRTVAMLSGIRANRVKIWCLVIVGLASSFAGNILLARIGAIQADTARGLEFEVIAGVVIGGTSLYGGQRNILRTIIGVIIIALIRNFLNLSRIDIFWQDFATARSSSWRCCSTPSRNGSGGPDPPPHQPGASIMDPTAKRTLGRTDVSLTQLGLGGAPLGDLFVAVPETQAMATCAAAWDSGIRYYDTAPWYGRGQSEHRVGRFLYQQRRSDYVLSTKVGRVLAPPHDTDDFDRGFWAGGLPFEHRFDYSYDGIMRAFEDSLQRLGITRVDLLLIHDLDFWHHATEAKVSAYLAQLFTSGWRALAELKAAGRIRGIGAGINELGMMPRFLDLVDIDFFLVALRYTLMEQDTLTAELPRCAERGVGIVVGGVFNSGLLATGAVRGAKYNYVDASDEALARASRIEAVCHRHGVPLPAAALQFPLGHSSVAAVIPGAISPKQVAANVAHFRHPIPGVLWSELKAEGLLREDAPVPTDEPRN